MALNTLGVCMTCAVKSKFHVGTGCSKCLKCYSPINGFDNEEFYIGEFTEQILKSPVQSSGSKFLASSTPVQTAGVGSAKVLRCLGAIEQAATEEDLQTQRRSKTVSIVTNDKGRCTIVDDAHRIDLAKLKTISKESVGVCLRCLIRIKQNVPLGKCPNCKNAINGFDDDEYYVRLDTEEMFVRVVVSSSGTGAKKALICVVVGVGVVGLGVAALPLIGFTSAGITAGSYAAGMMSAAATASGGGVAAGSLVATLQSMGAVGVGASAYAAGAGAGAVGVGAATGASSVLKKKAFCSACQEIFEIWRGTNTCPMCKGQTQDLMEKVDVKNFPLVNNCSKL